MIFPDENIDFKNKFEVWIDSIMSYDPSFGLRDDLGTKIDLLERAIQLARFHVGKDENQINYNDFLKLNIDFGNNKLIVLPFGKKGSEVHFEPHKPPEFQIPLAVHLLVHHGKGESVYSIIDSFIGQIRPSLFPLDLAKTATGVTRCFTNTRFAASGLRDQGLLKFTKREAYRTWELSFMGILVAGFLYYESWRDIKHDQHRYVPWWTIADTVQLIGNLPKVEFIKTLAVLCDQIKSDEDTIDSFKDKLDLILPLINRYSLVANAKKEGLQRNKNIAEIVAEIEMIPMVDKFVRDFRAEHEMVDFNKKITGFLRTSASDV